MANTGLLAERAKSVPANLSVSYASEGGLHMVSGRGCYLYDASGRAYLDAVNNVAHVGHSHPLVLGATIAQASALNTNTRYLSVGLNAYTARLLGTFPEPLSSGKVFLVASGSEANDLAMRLCRARSQSRRTALHQRPSANAREMDVFVCLSHAYHGATDSVIDISPYKYSSAGGRGRQNHVIEVPLPESFDEAPAVARILNQLQKEVDAVLASGRSICGFFAESILSCAGQVWVAPSFLGAICRIVRRAGGLCVADEVQTGFGRMGNCFWAFAGLGLTPDIVTCGKSIGNGYPIGAVITTFDVAHTFDNGMEYFNSCAGTNLAAAIGNAVLECIERENLLSHAHRVGLLLLQRLRALAADYPLLYDIRGQGLFLGIELRLPARGGPGAVLAQSTFFASKASPEVRLPQLPRQALPRCSAFPSSLSSACIPCASLTSGALCSWLCTALMLCTPLGVLVGSDGPLHNVVKIKPPMVFSERDAEYFCSALRLCLEALRGLHPCCFLSPRGTAAVPQARAKL